MEFNANKDCISVSATIFQADAEHSFDCDVTLPEYMPDIVRILRCTATVKVQSYQLNGDRLNTECECFVKVLYICDEGKVRCFDQLLHFSKPVELKSADVSADLCVGAKTDYVNYRVSGQRKFQVHGAVTIFVRAEDKKKYDFVNQVEGGFVTARCENNQICDLVSVVNKNFDVSETIETSSLPEPIGAIISNNGVAIIDEIKIISNKLFLKGEMNLRTVFTGQDSCQIHSFDSSIGINQIIEIPDVAENCDLDCVLSVVCVDARSRFDSAGNKNLLDVNATLNFVASAYCVRQVTCVKDAYSTKYESQLKKSVFYMPTLQEKIDDTFLCRGSADLGANGVTRVLSFACGDVTSSFAVQEDGIAIRGEVTTDIIYENKDGEITFAQRQIPFEYKRPMQAEDDVIACKPYCIATASSYILGEINKLDIRIEIQVHGFVFGEKEKSVVTEIVVDKSKLKSVKNAALTVYFAEKGESLWSIAEKYNTTVEAIIRENQLSGNCTEKKCKLLIPKV